MAKYRLLVASMIVAAPALAQVPVAPQQTAPTAAAAPQPAPATGAAATTPQTSRPATPAAPAGPAPAMTAQAAPVAPQTTDMPSQPAPAAAQAAPAAAQPTASQIASVIDSEFPSYDANKDGVLSAAEFDAWMVALKTRSDPATQADSPATRQWLGAAFAQADKDKSQSLSKDELTRFLSQGQS